MSKNPHHRRLKATEGSCLAITGIQGPLTEDPLKKKKSLCKKAEHPVLSWVSGAISNSEKSWRALKAGIQEGQALSGPFSL